MARRRFLRASLGLAPLLFSLLSSNAEPVFRVGKAFAQANMSDEVLTRMSIIAGVFITALHFATWILFWALNIIMDPAFIFDTQPGGRDGPLLNMIHEIWKLSRDLVNLGFAILLVVTAIGIAVYPTYFEKAKEKVATFVIAVVLVNFSWFIPRVIFDVSQILTYTVYQIPSLLVRGCTTIPDSSGAGGQPCEIITNMVFFEDTESIIPGVGGWKCPLRPLLCYQSRGYASTDGGQNGVLNGLIINYSRLRDLATISDPRAATGGDPVSIRLMITFLIKLIMVLVIHIALFFPILAVVVAFFIRIPVLWFTMAFMPFVALAYVVGGDKFGAEANPIDKLQKTFISSVFLPAIVGIPFAIGFILLNAAGTISTVPGAMRMNIPLFAGVADFWQLTWLFMSLFVLWTGVFAALKTQKIGADIIGKIEGYGKNLGTLAVKAPMSAPLIPTPGGGVSAGSVLGKLDPGKALQALRLKDYTDAQNLFKPKAAQDRANAGNIPQPVIDQIQPNVSIVMNSNNPGANQTQMQQIITELRKIPALRQLNGEALMNAYVQRMQAAGTPLTPQQIRNLQEAARQFDQNPNNRPTP